MFTIQLLIFSKGMALCVKVGARHAEIWGEFAGLNLRRKW